VCAEPLFGDKSKQDQATMNDNEHLTIIESHLKNLLALAEKRTQGKWICDGYNVKQPHGRQIADVGPHHTPPSEYPRSCKVQDEANGAFIAACAGNAEAGWKSTLAAIGHLREIESQGFCCCDKAFQEILAAFPIELLQ